MNSSNVSKEVICTQIDVVSMLRLKLSQINVYGQLSLMCISLKRKAQVGPFCLWVNFWTLYRWKPL